MAELKGAKISRAHMRNKARRDLSSLQVMLGKLEAKDTGQVTTSETAALTSTLDRARGSLDKYEAAINRCLVIEDKEEEDPEEENTIESQRNFRQA